MNEDATLTDLPYAVIGLASGDKLKVKGDWEVLLAELDLADRHNAHIVLTEHRPNGSHERLAVRISSIETVGPIPVNAWPTARQTADAMLSAVAACSTGYVGSGVSG